MHKFKIGCMCFSDFIFKKIKTKMLEIIIFLDNYFIMLT
jgi:hypothetical protein